MYFSIVLICQDPLGVLGVGHLAIHFHEVSCCRYNTGTILADGKNAFRYPMPPVSEANPTTELTSVSGT